MDIDAVIWFCVGAVVGYLCTKCMRGLRRMQGLPPAFKPGMRVKLKENAAEGWPEEYAHIIAYEGEGMWMVETEIKHGLGDDGLREVGTDQMELI